jgi:NADH dehydrogenase
MRRRDRQHADESGLGNVRGASGFRNRPHADDSVHGRPPAADEGIRPPNPRAELARDLLLPRVMETERRPRVVIIGAGFGGLTAAKALRHAPVEVVVIDRENYHLFQPLVYQVAMAELSGNDISASIRAVLAKQKNTRVLLGEVETIEFERQVVKTQDSEIAFDYLVVAGGTRSNYFGHDDWEAIAPSPKGLDAALEIRRRVLSAFEEAESLEGDSILRKRLLEFVIVGGGPTGVEFAGALAELSRRGLKRDFRRIDPSTARVHLVEGTHQVLSNFPGSLPESAARQLGELGVVIHSGKRVTQLDENGVTLSDGTRLDAATVIWAAGVKPVALSKMFADLCDREGRVKVQPDLSVAGHDNVFVIGDMAHCEQHGEPLPGLSPVAIQQGRAVARTIRGELHSKAREPFRYFDKGMLATIGRSRAVGVVGKLHFSGFIAWIVWAVVHIFYLIGFRNRVFVLIDWVWSYLLDRHAARIIFGLKHPLPSVRDRLRSAGPHAVKTPRALPS